jgi:hypothetical protein
VRGPNITVNSYQGVLGKYASNDRHVLLNEDRIIFALFATVTLSAQMGGQVSFSYVTSGSDTPPFDCQ